MRRLIWGFGGHTYHIVGKLMSRLKRVLNSLHAGYYSWFCCHHLTFFKISLFKNFFLEHYQTVKLFGLFVWFESLRPINNLSVKQGLVFLGWTSTKLGLLFLLKDTTQWHLWGSNPRPLSLESSTLPLSHCAPVKLIKSWSGPTICRSWSWSKQFAKVISRWQNSPLARKKFSNIINSFISLRTSYIGPIKRKKTECEVLIFSKPSV